MHFHQPFIGQLENLESAWNLEHGSLNADSRYNMFPLTKQFRRLFDDGDYILIPTTEILGVYGANRSIPVGADFPNVPNGLFEYTLMPRPSLQEVTIHRPSALRNTIAHNYPFEKLGTLKSHLHPRFVIWNLGHQIDQALLPFREALRHLEAVNAFDTPGKYELLSRLLDAHQIYEKWSEERVPPRPRPNLGLAPSVSSSQQTRRRRAIPPSMSATCAYGMPALTKRNLKELGNSSCDDSMPWHFTITRWQALCEVASCADEGCGIYPDTFGNDDDDSSDLECDFDADTADVEMGYAVPFQDGIGDDVPQAEMCTSCLFSPVLHQTDVLSDYSVSLRCLS
ncbi:hypothetical protein PLICRDRAFT_290384 [Plicaturopsis crispa FD-325 SS-3]|nr:hypothetical protein PLICRDRAFT_290384 [Plicaturopsis crispa FD-325 SS-3]